MDVIKSQQISSRPIKKVIVHPLVLLSIVDNYNRVAKDTRKCVVRVLLGSSFRGIVDVTNSYAGPRITNFTFDCSLFFSSSLSQLCLDLKKPVDIMVLRLNILSLIFNTVRVRVGITKALVWTLKALYNYFLALYRCFNGGNSIKGS